jgi:hypothetical protein
MNINQVNYELIMIEDYKRQREQAQYRDAFYEGDNYIIHTILKKDLAKYGISQEKINNTQLYGLDKFIKAFEQKISNVYDTAPLIKLDNGTAKENELLGELLEDANINNVFNSNLEKIKLHNTIINQIKRIDTGQIYIDNRLNIGNTFLYGNDYNWQVLMYETLIENELYWYVFDKELKEHYFVISDSDTPPNIMRRNTKRIDGDIILIDNDITAPEYNPFVVYRYDLQNDFWGNGNDALVDLVRLVNVLLTVTGGDNIRETLRVLYSNMNVKGTKNDVNKYETTMGSMLMPADNTLDRNVKDLKIQVTQATLYNTEVLEFIEAITTQVSMLHNIDNPIKKQLESNLSGIALQLKKEPLMRDWQRDITRMKFYDRQLIDQLIKINNIYNKGKISENKKILIDYQTPKMVMDEAGDWDLWKSKITENVATPIDYIMKQNPELTYEECLKKYNENKILNEQLFGINVGLDVE